MPFTIVSQGTQIQPATAINLIVPLPSGCDYFKTYNLTQLATTQSTGRNVMGEWFGGGLTAVNDGIDYFKSNSSSNAMNVSTFAQQSVNGFTYVNSFPAPQAALTGTTITQATNAVASVTNTYSNGDQVVIYNAVGMQQISGMTFTISSVSGSGFTLLGLNSSGFATAATSFMVRRVALYTPVEPSYLYVTGISQATQGVVTVSQQHNYQVGQAVEFTIPGSFGMVQLNNYYLPQNKPPIITAVTAYTFTINVNTSGFTAFAFPASASSPTAQLFATVAPAGQQATYNPITGIQTGYNFQYVPFRTGIFVPYMMVSAGAQSPGGSAGDTIVWQAYKMETGTINSPVPS
jgi:hypothetical protein